MKIAVPVVNGRLSPHFGHCNEFAFVDCDPGTGKIESMEMVPVPDHQPGLLPRWLAERNAEVIIAGGMGARAKGLFQQQNIKVVIGAPSEDPESIVGKYLSGELKTGDNICDH